MPQSKTRHHHHHPVPPRKARPVKSRRAILVPVIFFAIIGLGIAWFVAPNNSIALSIGAVIGAVAGYFFGKQVEKA